MTLIFSLLACTVIHGSGDTQSDAREVADFGRLDNATQIDVSWTQGEPSAVLSCDAELLPYIELRQEDSTLKVRSEEGVVLVPEGPCTLALSSACLGSYQGSGSGGLEVDAGCEIREIHLSGSGGVDVATLASDFLDIDLSGSGGVSLGAVQTGPMSVELSGSGGVGIDSLEAGDLDVQFSGSAGMSAAGTAGDLELKTSGSGGLDAQGLSVQDAEVRMSSSASNHVAVYGLLDADLSGSGSLHVYGDPVDVSVSSSGSGDVEIHRD